MKDERDDKILDLYLQCWTQQMIADELNMPRQTITDVIKKIAENGDIAKIGEDFKPFIYKNRKIKPLNRYRKTIYIRLCV